MKNQKGIAPIVIILIIIGILAVAGGIYYYQNPQKIIKFKDAVVPDNDVSNWQTYRDETRKFEIKYPPSILFKECFITSFDYDSSRLCQSDMRFLIEMGPIGLINDEDQENYLEEITQTTLNHYDNPKESTIQIDSIDSLVIEGKTKEKAYGDFYGKSYIIPIRDISTHWGTFYHIAYVVNSNEKSLGYDLIFEKMISTFKLID